ncbi:type II toxin-antitoxin system VapB family antitoxin [Paucibacter sp. XJ19-41]|uniref:type II toxin-antitoxin system VapB family antitoxin n=1 Tax=Paucibacter sp. XJ19-41 TaxID=2927824 RepID=UPI00234A5B62|nr:type II toxin-antitoxin system VapB family antitoxin [Paucibacter sp. XJ19-41]MDC6171207.1 type II toxin-antitoxin system VapB family antitoxin [Paucibacter sp. XJ19-41]
MAVQIANPVVVDKVERLAKATGLSKTAVVEQALDRLLMERGSAPLASPASRLAALLAQMDRIPDRADAFDALDWDAQGLPR